ncbi:MAG: tRNA pseudouridine(55) synthase TruB [Acidimicrobiia bacterium]|nr:tRNA pseudouridine(55) synthase TruB [Acidimicrobiia bacterium]
MPDGFLLVDKPGGWTSHDVVARCRRLMGERRLGHAGTLDPMATGLLVLGLGRATRLLRFVQHLPKVYRAVAVLGVATDTLDADGAVLWRRPMPVTEEEVRRAGARFVGVIAQVPPMVSARRVEGRRLYDLAREGKEVEREARPVEVHSFELLDFAPSEYPEATWRIRCSSGTYIRTLADDLARSLGGRAHLTALRRLSSGSLRVGQAHTLEGLEAAAAAGRAAEALLDPAEALADLPAVRVTTETAAAVCHGAVFPAPLLGITPPAAGPHRVLDPGGRLLAVYRVEGKAARPEVVVA